jgi:hypothetical protein
MKNTSINKLSAEKALSSGHFPASTPFFFAKRIGNSGLALANILHV